MKKTTLFLGLLSAIFLGGCSQKMVTIKTQVPAKIDALTKKRVIAILPFKGDNVNFEGKLESKLANVRLNGKNYFKLVDRERIHDILKELKFQSSDLVANKVANFGKLSGAQVLITGKVKAHKAERIYRKSAERCVKWGKTGCLYYKTFYVTCKISNAVLNVLINAIDVNSGEVLDAFDADKVFNGDSCKYNYIPSNEALKRLTDEVANEYIERVAPHYTYISVGLIDDVESINLSSLQEKMFKNSLIYIEHGHFKQAEYLLKRLNRQVNNQSYEILYDLGVVEEALGKLDEAKVAYNTASKIILDKALKPNELVDKAIERIDTLIKKKQKLKTEI